MYFLDTDHISLLERAGIEGTNIRRRLRSVPLDDQGTTIISYEEQIRGWTASLARVSSVHDQVIFYTQLQRQIRNYASMFVVGFDTNAADQFEALRAAKIRIGTMDLKIAAICLVNDATLLTRNVSDFGKVPGLKTEDWTSYTGR